MHNLILKWWNSLNITSKILAILLLLSIFFASSLAIEKAIYKYRYFKELETQVEVLQDSILNYEKRISGFISAAKILTTEIKQKSLSIDKKLKKDEKTIYNSNITDDQIELFLSRFGN
jgi:hypothetical protein